MGRYVRSGLCRGGRAGRFWGTWRRLSSWRGRFCRRRLIRGNSTAGCLRFEVVPAPQHKGRYQIALGPVQGLVDHRCLRVAFGGAAGLCRRRRMLAVADDSASSRCNRRSTGDRLFRRRRRDTGWPSVRFGFKRDFYVWTDRAHIHVRALDPALVLRTVFAVTFPYKEFQRLVWLKSDNFGDPAFSVSAAVESLASSDHAILQTSDRLAVKVKDSQIKPNRILFFWGRWRCCLGLCRLWLQSGGGSICGRRGSRVCLCLCWLRLRRGRGLGGGRRRLGRRRFNRLGSCRLR